MAIPPKPEDSRDHDFDPATNHPAAALPEKARWQRFEELFHQASELPPEQRVERLQVWCGTDSAMLAELLVLLESDSSVNTLMAAALPVNPDDFLARDTAEDPWIGRVLGAFCLERLLGRGGMGVVYLGKRLTKELSQKVAVKLMARHLQSTPAQTHFLLERDALAQLEHRNIARLLDGGVTEEELPYVVMEYVEGRRLDTVCDDPAISVEQVLRLMLQLCDAVSYVHRNLILHRDLKPGNVIVTDDGGVVKLLDFGTLKMLGAASVANSAMTQAGMRPVTMRYASPEHIRGDAVSTASDVYSLGMILYRLIAGHLPEGKEGLSIGQYLEHLKTDRIAPPSGSLRGASGSADAGSKIVGKKMDPAMAKDLDVIVLKAIRYEPEERYAGADALAADLWNVLESKPVSARTATSRYRVERFYRRNKVPVLGTVAALLVLIVGLVAMTRQAKIARAEQRRAEAGVEDERKLAHLLLFDYFEQLKQIPGSTDAQRKAVSQALAYLDGLSPAARNSNLKLDSVQAYTEMGALLGSPYEENLGDVPGAIRTLEKAVSLSQPMLASHPKKLEYLQSAAAAELALGRVYFGSGDPQHAVVYLKPAAETSRRIAATPGVDSAVLAEAASVVDGLGDVYGQEDAVSLNDPAKAIQRYQQAQAIDLAGLKLDPHCDRCRRGIALEYWKLGMLTEGQDQNRAADLYNAALATLTAFTPAEQATSRVLRIDTVIRQQLGTIYLHTGRTVEGLHLLQMVRQRFQSSISADPVDARARFDLAALDSSLADGDDDLRRYKAESDADLEFLENMNVLVHLDPKSVGWQFHRAEALLRYGKLQLQLGQRSEGERTSKEGLALIIPLAQQPTAEANILGVASDYLVSLHPGPKRDAPMAVDFAQRAIAASPRPSAGQYLTLAEAQRFAGQTEQSKGSAEAALAILVANPKSIGNAAQLAHANRLIHH